MRMAVLTQAIPDIFRLHSGRASRNRIARSNFDLGSFRKSILDKLYRPASGNAGPWKKVTVGGKSYFEMSDSAGNHISTTAFEPIDDEACASPQPLTQRSGRISSKADTQLSGLEMGKTLAIL